MAQSNHLSVRAFRRPFTGHWAARHLGDLPSAAVTPNPFLTDELRVARNRQRRILRKVPVRIVGPLDTWVSLAPRGLPATDSLAIETELRRLAEMTITDVVPVLASFELADLGDPIVAFFESAAARRAHDLGLGALHVAALHDSLVRQFVEEADMMRVRRQAALEVRLDDERSASMVRLAVLLVVADELADDGYRDPRITAVASVLDLRDVTGPPPVLLGADLADLADSG